MEFFEHTKVAFKSLLENKVRSFLTMLGVIIGVGSVILLVSITTGFKEYLIAQFTGLGTNLLIITPGKTETKGDVGHPTLGVRNLTLEDVSAIKKYATAVDGATPIVFGTGEVKYKKRMRRTKILGVDEDFTKIINIHVSSGRFITQKDAESARRICTIGYTISKDLFGYENPLGKFVRIGNTRLRIVGLMEKKGTIFGTEDLDDIVYMPAKTAQNLFHTDSLIGIRARARSRMMIDVAKDQVTSILKKRHGNSEDFTVFTQQAMLATMDSILKALSTVLAGIAAISLLVGGIGIMNIMLVSVRERTREVGIRKAVGARKIDILLQFLIEAVVLSFSGGTVGIMLAFLGTIVTSMFIPQIPPILTLWAIILATFFSIFVGVFFGVYPAYKAAQMHPIEALRYE